MRFTVWVQPVVPDLTDPVVEAWEAQVLGPQTRDGAGPIVTSFKAPWREDVVARAVELRDRLNAIQWGEYVQEEGKR